MSALRECPGCGNFSMPYVSKRREGVWRVACDECGFAGPEDDTEPAAIAAWNRRAGDDEAAKAHGYLTRNVLQAIHPECEPLPDLLGLCTMSYAYWDAGNKDWRNDHYGVAVSETDVSHWRPLPTPPEPQP